MDENEIKSSEVVDLDEEFRLNLIVSKAKMNENLLVIELQNQIKTLLSQISVIYEDEKKKVDLDEYTKRLVQTKKKLNSVQATILAVQERLNRIYVTIQKDPYLKHIMSSESPKSKLTQNPLFDDYEGSEFEYSTTKSPKSKDVLFKKPETKASSSLPSKTILSNEQMKNESQIRSFHYRSMNAYARHVKLVNDYLIYYSGGKSLKEVFQRDTSKDKTDLDVIREEMKFIWDEDETPTTWEQRLAKKYYDKLFKEYCICDLTLYKQNKIAMRWRVEKEVLTGKGQFICGDKRCSIREGLKTWEVNFGYVEHGEKKNALVKLRLCPECSVKLNFHHKKKEYVKPQKLEKRKKLKKIEKSGSESESSEDESEIKEKKLKKEIENDSKKDEKCEEKMTSDGNMIILESDDSMWKSNVGTSEKLNVDEAKAREEEFEEYLEDLFF
ncbi:unnamed protein product [Brachionus calyciflorus]|uniref:FRA10AC1 n=1 Tax=Brachionus calyciflorus TaxID=104777 RepID=A0A813YEZ5_9BILA|nr:unnamed protein product [Brachionus calyciflorus]